MNVKINKDFSAKLKVVKAAAKKAGIRLKGNARKGQFAGANFAGHYVVNGDDLTVTMTKIPWYVTERIVRHKLEGIFL